MVAGMKRILSPRRALWTACITTLGLLAAGAGCAAGPAPQPPTLQARIDALIGDARCSTDEVCRSIGVGAKACGGPAGYRAWSTELTDETALRALVARQSEERQRAMARSGEMSDCAIVPDPGAYCQRLPSAAAGHCQLRPSGGPAGNSSLR